MVSSYRRNLDKHLANYRLACGQVEAEEKALTEAEERVLTVAKAVDLVQRVAEKVQASASAHIAAVVDKCLKTVFGEDAYDYAIRFERKRNKTEARLLFLLAGQDIDPLDSSGGGTVDMAAFANRLAALLLTQPFRRKLLVLDEPCKHLSREYRPAVRTLLEDLASDLEMQLVLVTHSPELAVGKIIEVGEE